MEAEIHKRVILFADIGGSTDLYERVGDVQAHRLVANSLALMRACIESHRGELLRTVGDSSLASFQHAEDALQAACAMQNAHVMSPVSIRVGFHLGDVIPDGGDVYGHAVNVAARIASFARLNEITATTACVDRLSPESRRTASFLDSIPIKGVTEPVEVWRMEWLPEDGARTAVATALSSQELAPAVRARIELRQGKRRIERDSDASAVILGRATDCDMIVDNDEASRRHAVIEFHQGQCLLTDTSTNGTWLCRPRAQPVLIRRDTVVIDGRGELGLGKLPGEPGAAPLAFQVHAVADEDEGSADTDTARSGVATGRP